MAWDFNRRRGAASGARVSNEQTELLTSYLERHPLLARGQITKLGPQGHVKSKTMWKTLVDSLNEMGPAIRDVQGWQNYWTRIRLAAKTKKANFLRSLTRTGNDAVVNTMSEIDERICDIYGTVGVGWHFDNELGFNFMKSNACQDSSDQPQNENELSQLFEEIDHLIGFRMNAKTTARQIDTLVQYMLNNIGLARDEIEDQREVEAHWAEITRILNSLDASCNKPMRGWMKTWADLVGTARQNVTLLQAGLRNIPLARHHLTILRIVGDLADEVEEGSPGLPPPANQSTDNFAPVHTPPPPPPPAKKRTFCSIDQLMASTFGPVTKRPHLSMTENCNGPSSMDAGSSARPDTRPNPVSNAFADKSSMLVALLESKAMAIFQGMEARIQENRELQTGLLQSFLEEQFRVLKQSQEQTIRQVVAVELARLDLPGQLRQMMAQQTQNIIDVAFRPQNPAAEARPHNQPSQQTQNINDVAFRPQNHAAEARPHNQPSQSMQPAQNDHSANRNEAGNVMVAGRIHGARNAVEDEDEGIDMDDICVICHQRISRPKKINCGHVFCTGCLKKWMRYKETCPICRSSIETFTFVNGTLTFMLDSSSDTE